MVLGFASFVRNKGHLCGKYNLIQCTSLRDSFDGESVIVAWGCDAVCEGVVYDTFHVIVESSVADKLKRAYIFQTCSRRMSVADWRSYRDTICYYNETISSLLFYNTPVVVSSNNGVRITYNYLTGQSVTVKGLVETIYQGKSSSQTIVYVWTTPECNTTSVILNTDTGYFSGWELRFYRKYQHVFLWIRHISCFLLCMFVLWLFWRGIKLLWIYW